MFGLRNKNDYYFEPGTFEVTKDPQPKFSMLDDMVVSRGTKEDWEVLHELHYKSTVMPPGPRVWTCKLDTQIVGVCVFSLPRLTLKARRVLMPNIKTGGDTRIINKYRADFLNANFTVNSRIVVDTMFRGAGIAYRLTNLAMRLDGKRYIEIQSSMSKYNKFGERAGFRFITPVRGGMYEDGLKFMRENFEAHPADHVAIMNELNAMTPRKAKLVLSAMRLFYQRNSVVENSGVGGNKKAEAKVAAMDTTVLVKNLQQLVFASPLYGVYQNPDVGRTDLPDSLPLTSFDKQSVTERLKL